MKDRYTSTELLYAATTRCPCGAGMAYPLDHDDAQEISAWVCSRVLLCEVEIPSGAQPPSAGFFSPVTRVDTAGQAHHGLPFNTYSIKSEGQPSAQGASTRPAGAHVESEPHCRCLACGHEYVAARRRNDTQRNNEGMDCPKCGATYLAAGGALGTQIEVRSRTVVVLDGEAAPALPVAPFLALTPASALRGARIVRFEVVAVDTSEGRFGAEERRADGQHRVLCECEHDTADAAIACATPRSVPGLARAAFEAYGESTGGVTWDGKPIPPFETIRERTPHVASAWEAAADAVRKLVKP